VRAGSPYAAPWCRPGLLRSAGDLLLPNAPVLLKKTFNCVAFLAAFRLRPVRPFMFYLPVRLADGKVQGVVRLKQVAAATGKG